MERGASSTVAVAVVLLVAVGSTALARLSVAARDDARAGATADVVALAGVGGGPDAAERVAEANGAVLDALEQHPHGRVTATVDAAGHRAQASAAPLGAAITDPEPAPRPR